MSTPTYSIWSVYQCKKCGNHAAGTHGIRMNHNRSRQYATAAIHTYCSNCHGFTSHKRVKSYKEKDGEEAKG